MKPPTGPAGMQVYTTNDGKKKLLGTVANRSKLLQFSHAARQALPARELVLEGVDEAAGRTIIAWINGNSLTRPKPLLFRLLGSNPQFVDGCKIHHASYMFQLRRDLRGDDIRNRLFEYIRAIRNVTLAEFQMVQLWLYFDSGLVLEMKRKIAYHTVREWIPDEERGQLMYYFLGHDVSNGTTLVKEMVELEAFYTAEVAREAEKRTQATAIEPAVESGSVTSESTVIITEKTAEGSEQVSLILKRY